MGHIKRIVILSLLSLSVNAQTFKVDTNRHEYKFKELLRLDMQTYVVNENLLDNKIAIAHPNINNIKISPKKTLNFQFSTRIRLYYFSSWKKFKTGCIHCCRHVNLVLPRPF